MAKRKFKIKNLNWSLIFGLLLIAIFFGWKYHQARILSFNTTEVANFKFSGIKPVHIKSYPVGVDVDIKPAVILDGVWPVFPDSAGYVANGNNLIIYGHNKDNILGPIRWIKIGAEIEIVGSDGKKYIYKVVKIDEVNPNNLYYIQNKDSETLTFYTCSGFFDSKRFIVVAKPV